MWPRPSPRSAFALRRQKLARGLKTHALFASGMSRPRNFRANRYPFRAESHFLYLVGRALEGAVLLIAPGSANPTLYAEPPDPEEALWSGPEPSLEALASELELDVRPLSELDVPAD